MPEPNGDGAPVSFYVDGAAAHGAAGEPLIALLERLGANVPHVCYHPSLGPIETCDTCMVRVGGELRRACATPLAAGMRVDTRGSVRVRKEAMNRLLGNHELYCTVCDFNNGNCNVHNATAALGIEHQKYPFTRKGYPIDDSNPFYRYDPDQCILCGRCVEACQNVQVTETLSIDWEAEQPRVLWDGGAPINESSCVSCGHCVTVCPCNALMEKSMLGEAGLITGMPEGVRRGSIELVKYAEQFTGYGPIFALSDAEERMREGTIRKTKTVCTYCGVGCSFDVWTKGRTILKVEPRPEAPANGISTCVKGKFGWDYTNSEERLTTPLVRDGDHFRATGWEEALDYVAHRLLEIRTKHGPDSIGFIGSSKCTNEESYLTQKIARVVIGTNNVDNCSRYCQAPATMGLWRTVGYGGDAGTMDDLRHADLLLMVGTNTAISHPVLAAHLRRAQKLRGQTHIVADLRAHEMARRADVFLRPAPGTDLVWLSAVTRYILDQGLEDRAFLERWVNDLAEYRESLEPFTLDFAEGITGIPADTLREVAERVAAAATVCGVWAMGVTQHHDGSDTSTAISNLLLVTGNYGRPGTGGYPLRGHNNVQGCSDFGCIPTFYPGYEKTDDPGIRARYESYWGTELSDRSGLNNTTMIEAIHAGKLKALFVVGEELPLADANSTRVREALERLEFFAVQDVFFTTAARYADVVLSASPSLEKEGTFVNTERRVQRLYEALPPLGNSRPDWVILTELARRMGHDWGYAHPSEIMDEVAGVSEMFAGVRYDRLEGYASLCWPVAADGTDTPLLYTDHFHFPDGKAKLYPLAWDDDYQKRDAEFDLHLNNGRLLEHFHEGTMTYKVPGIAAKKPDTFVELSPALATAREVETGDWVRLTSPDGAVTVRVQVSEEVRDGEMYMPLNSSEQAVNTLTSSRVDPASDTPAYKDLAVRLEKLGRRGPAPVPRGNPRFGNPTPQRGVEVERKWARDDYEPPVRDRPAGGNV
ncbi:formate dehydrogenase subunit alpha [soil metagenome]